MAGLAVGGFIAIVIVIFILNVAGVIGYNMFTKKNPDKAVSMNLDSGLVEKLRYGLFGLIVLSWMFSIACTVTCTFVKVTQTATVDLGVDSIYNTVYSTEYFLGMRGIEVSGECNTGDLGEDRINTAYAFGVINNLLTTAALIGVPLVILNVIKGGEKANKVWKIMGFLMLASTWCCLFTFYIQQTVHCDGISYMGVECSLGGAGVAQVFNSMFLIGICVLFFILPLPVPEDGENSNEDDKKDKEDEEVEKKEGAPEEANKSKESDEDEEDGEEGDFVNAEED
mmetsp:Transcript_30474/g.73104  ORF Transcript_30474/g.73104 Transcript_30474/m.73104 type:complete len:283 (-) Transcript_30474:328-1176(-)|eukprot:CAMPEP_0113627946 /NCGR_PEP_ID=MMETSP0017_2-20120614/14475_1 /TAXON_ID=2856 /ORGANISM="Cylindrotheca closterium" /LENGTH=282 /DNA_ID=CAMNT_0000538223 /DNA_START=57 /DNA_END=905 /DNA_ORIENTATION=- /assembly_acc=CAM_ASM_000147